MDKDRNTLYEVLKSKFGRYIKSFINDYRGRGAINKIYLTDTKQVETILMFGIKTRFLMDILSEIDNYNMRSSIGEVVWIHFDTPGWEDAAIRIAVDYEPSGITFFNKEGERIG